MLRALPSDNTVDPAAPASLGRDDDLAVFPGRVRELVVELRDKRDAGIATAGDLSALHFIEGYALAVRRCMAGVCKPSGWHSKDRCFAGGKSRPASSGSERPLAAAV